MVLLYIFECDEMFAARIGRFIIILIPNARQLATAWQ